MVSWIATRLRQDTGRFMTAKLVKGELADLKRIGHCFFLEVPSTTFASQANALESPWPPLPASQNAKQVDSLRVIERGVSGSVSQPSKSVGYHIQTQLFWPPNHWVPWLKSLPWNRWIPWNRAHYHEKIPGDQTWRTGYRSLFADARISFMFLDFLSRTIHMSRDGVSFANFSSVVVIICRRLIRICIVLSSLQYASCSRQ